MMKVRILVTGRVQGVCFRISTFEKAMEYGLSGEVRNLPDGRVEIMAEGEEALINKLVSWARHGPPGALVTDLEVSEEVGSGKYSGFRITG